MGELFLLEPERPETFGQAAAAGEFRLWSSLFGLLVGGTAVLPLVQVMGMSALLFRFTPNWRQHTLCALLVGGPGTLSGFLVALGGSTAGGDRGDPLRAAFETGWMWAIILAFCWVPAFHSERWRLGRTFWRMLAMLLLAPLAPALGAR